MKPAWHTQVKHAFRIATLVVPSWIAWYIAFEAKRPGELEHVVKLALGPLWFFIAVVLLARSMGIVFGRKREGTLPSLARIDVLTSSGVALGWFSALAIASAVLVGWASLAVVGMLGTAVFYVVVLYAFLALRGEDPMKRGTIARRFSPDTVSEGESVIEELRFTGTRIPVGYRLLISGRIGPRWATSRHVLDTAGSDGEVVLESDVGPAVRGAHEPEPLEAWLEDTFGLCRSPRVPIEAGTLTVLPRSRTVDKKLKLSGRGVGPRAPRAASALPTEGHFNLREYQQGDDVRRIHWVRSLAARELIVRLPDEIPPDRPRVRLLLDTFFPEASVLACDATAELLDALVAVWLAVGRALVDSGTRVTLVTALPREDSVDVARHALTLRDSGAALRLGARVSWQSTLTVDRLVTAEETWIVSRGIVTPLPPSADARWVLVRPNGTEPSSAIPSALRAPFPAGSAENRWSHRTRIADEICGARSRHARAALVMSGNVVRPPPGTLVAAITTPEAAIRLEALR